MSQGLPIALDASENVPETPGEPSTKTEVTLPPKAGPTTTTGGPRPPKTTTEIVKEGGIGAIKAVDEVVKGLNGLFGDPIHFASALPLMRKHIRKRSPNSLTHGTG